MKTIELILCKDLKIICEKKKFFFVVSQKIHSKKILKLKKKYKKIINEFKAIYS